MALDAFRQEAEEKQFFSDAADKDKAASLGLDEPLKDKIPTEAMAEIAELFYKNSVSIALKEDKEREEAELLSDSSKVVETIMPVLPPL